MKKMENQIKNELENLEKLNSTF